ncbi:MAG: DUF3887 domain-containing protein [Desulfobacteraceae bacterium]|nr:DUF3887 domain-containing protein [Desulfobacteraceae bacterium]
MNGNLSGLFLHTMDVSLQASVMIPVIMLIKQVLGKRLSPGWHYGLWFLLILRLLLPWSPESTISIYNLFPLPAQLGFDGGLSGFPAPAAGAPAPGPFHTAPGVSALPPFIKALPFIWIFVAFAMLAYIFIRSLAFLMAVRNHSQVTRESALNLLESCKRELGIKTVLVIMETDLVQSPALFGYIRPRILLPRGMIGSMDENALRHVLLHELRHLKNHDILTGLIAAFLLALHWFNPLVWISFYRMKRDREFACDAMTLSHLTLPEHREYGLVLLNLSCSKKGNNGKTEKNPFRGLTGIMEYKSEIKRRIEMIAAFKKRSPWYTLVVTASYLLLGLTVLTSAQISATKSPTDLTRVSKTLVDHLVKGEYEKVTAHYDATMARALPPEKLKAAWEGLIINTGAFKAIKGTRSGQHGEFDIIFVTCDFTNGPLDIKFVFNNESRISGMWFVPAQPE